jgi:uncharacterized membrane protein YfcA
MTIFWLIILGIVAGILSGLLGVGGGIIIVPALVLLFGYSQKLAQGTTLLLLIPPIGAFAAYSYYKHGHTDVRAAIFIILGFLIGSIGGAYLANHLSDQIVSKIFGGFLLIVAIKFLV